MKMTLLLSLSIVIIVTGCSTPEVPTYGIKMSDVKKQWGSPDDTMAYQDYKDTGYYSMARVGGAWSSQGGAVSGYSYGGTYTPTAIVWIYKKRDKALIFEKRGLLFDERHTLLMEWKLVGWQTLKSDKETSSSSTSSPASDN